MSSGDDGEGTGRTGPTPPPPWQDADGVGSITPTITTTTVQRAHLTIANSAATPHQRNVGQAQHSLAKHEEVGSLVTV